VKVLEQEFRGLQAEGREVARNEQLRQNIDSNARALDVANKEIEQLKQQVQVETDNRGLLNSYFDAQGNGLVTNEVMRLGSNFAQPAPQTAAPAKSEEMFDQQWLGLSKKSGPQDEAKTEEKPAEPGQAQGGRKGDLLDRVQSEMSLRAQQRARTPGDDAAAQQVFKGQQAQTDQQEQGGEQGQERQPAAQGTKESLKRAYSDKIEQQQLAEEATVAGALATPMQRQSLAVDRSEAQTSPMSERRVGVHGLMRDGSVLQWSDDSGTVMIPQGGAQVPGRVGLASLDFELPQRGTTYFFTTPRSNVEISMRPVNSRLLQQLTNFGWLLLLVVVALCSWWLVQKITRLRHVRIVLAAMLCIAGPVLIVMGILPLLGIVMILGGILLIFEAGGGRPEAIGNRG
jgi:hypothetical protein